MTRSKAVRAWCSVMPNSRATTRRPGIRPVRSISSRTRAARRSVLAVAARPRKDPPRAPAALSRGVSRRSGNRRDGQRPVQSRERLRARNRYRLGRGLGGVVSLGAALLTQQLERDRERHRRPARDQHRRGLRAGIGHVRGQRRPHPGTECTPGQRPTRQPGTPAGQQHHARGDDQAVDRQRDQPGPPVLPRARTRAVACGCKTPPPRSPRPPRLRTPS